MRLSPKAVAVLRDVSAGRDPWCNCHSRSEHGGRYRMIWSLQRKGLIKKTRARTGPLWELTDDGRYAVAQAAVDEEERRIDAEMSYCDDDDAA